MRLIQATDLKVWASTKQAESLFPQLVRDLICAVIVPEKLHIPFGDAIWVPGVDARVACSETNRFVPHGLSVWEFGTDAKYAQKANRDYEKRSFPDPDAAGERVVDQDLDRSQTTFVFSTPRVWRDKHQWIAQRKLDAIWKDVVVCDGTNLQDWLDDAPSVSLQFADRLRLILEDGLWSPETAWSHWSNLTSPPATEQLVVAGREEQQNELIGCLLGPPGIVIVRAESPREAWGFTLAAIRRVASAETRQNMLPRVLIADNEASAYQLHQRRNHIIVLKESKGQVSGFLSPLGFHVIVPEGNAAYNPSTPSAERTVVKLGRPTHHQFSEALQSMGFPPNKAEELTRTSGLSVTVLQRHCPSANVEHPSWLDSDAAAQLIPALLAGRWNSRSEADRALLCTLADVTTYGAVERRLQRFLSVNEPPLLKIGEL